MKISHYRGACFANPFLVRTTEPPVSAPVQRIVYARNEANYCAPCQTGGKLLSDRALSRLLKSDWPKTLDELERRRRGASPPKPRI